MADTALPLHVPIAGYGVAGCAAAIEAHDSDPDADVLVVEKMAEPWAGGNGRASGQSLLISHDADALYRRTIAIQRALLVLIAVWVFRSASKMFR